MIDLSNQKIPQVSASDVYRAVTEKNECVILDVRTPQEYARGKIAGSINVPLSDIGKNIQNIIPDKSVTIYVYCLSGSRSVLAVDTMTHMGYTHVYNIISGLLAWRGSKYLLVI